MKKSNKIQNDWNGTRDWFIRLGLGDYVISIDQAMADFIEHPNPTTGIALSEQMHALIKESRDETKISESAALVELMKSKPPKKD